MFMFCQYYFYILILHTYSITPQRALRAASLTLVRLHSANSPWCNGEVFILLVAYNMCVYQHSAVQSRSAT